MLLKIRAKVEVVCVCLCIILFPLVAFICILTVGLTNSESNLIALAVLCLMLSAIFAISILPRIQWFLIFQNRIVVKNIFGIVNSVDFSNVKYVEQKKLPLFTKDHEVAHYVFIDGRPERKRGITQHSSTVNFKKTSVRVYITPELTSIVKNHGFNIVALD